MSGPATVCDLLKTLRSDWWATGELAALMDMDPQTARSWLIEMERQGLVVSRKGERSASVGKAPTVYTLAPAWGGLYA